MRQCTHRDHAGARPLCANDVHFGEVAFWQHIATLVERHTRYVMLAKVAGKDTQTVVSALIKQAKKLPTELYKSLTWDRGKELKPSHERNWRIAFCQ
jgi:IS30 family transposase